jgi:hypothetical protein
MKPVAWRVFRNNRWTYSEDNHSRHDERHLWQPLYSDIDIQAEREACAKVCNNLTLEHPGRADLTSIQCANAIRARGQHD